MPALIPLPRIMPALIPLPRNNACPHTSSQNNACPHTSSQNNACPHTSSQNNACPCPYPSSLVYRLPYLSSKTCCHVACPYSLSFFYMLRHVGGGEGEVEELMVMFSTIIIIPLDWLIMWTFENSDLKKQPFFNNIQCVWLLTVDPLYLWFEAQ